MSFPTLIELRNQVKQRLIEQARDFDANKLAQTVIPTIPFEPTDDEPVMVVGGKPMLPIGTEWPTHRTGFGKQIKLRPLQYVCRINLDDLTEFGPTVNARLNGTLLVFLEEIDHLQWGFNDDRECYGRDENDDIIKRLRPLRSDYRVIHVDDAVDLIEVDFPTGMSAVAEQRLGMGTLFGEIADCETEEMELATGEAFPDMPWDLIPHKTDYSMFGWMSPQQSCPRHHCPSQENMERDDNAYDRLPKVPEFDYSRPDGMTDEAFNQRQDEQYAQFKTVLNKRDEMMNDPEWQYIRGSHHPYATESHRDWVQLLRIYSMDDGFDWGDSTIHLMIRKDDLSVGRFDRTYVVWQCT